MTVLQGEDLTGASGDSGVQVIRRCQSLGICVFHATPSGLLPDPVLTQALGTKEDKAWIGFFSVF